MGGNPIQFDYTLSFSVIFSLAFFAFVVYLMVSVLHYLKCRTKTDRELILKLDELIKLQQESDKTP